MPYYDIGEYDDEEQQGTFDTGGTEMKRRSFVDERKQPSLGRRIAAGALGGLGGYTGMAQGALRPLVQAIRGDKPRRKRAEYY